MAINLLNWTKSFNRFFDWVCSLAPKPKARIRVDTIRKYGAVENVWA